MDMAISTSSTSFATKTWQPWLPWQLFLVSITPTRRLPYQVSAKEKKEEGKKMKRGKKGKNSEFSRHLIISYATEH
jgi:hypothetical protein